MENGWLQTQRAHRARATDAKDHFLADTRRFIAAVQAIADVAIRRRVLGTVRVHEIHRYAADLRLPHARYDVAPTNAHRDRQPLAVLVDGFDWEIARIVVPVLCVLNAVVIDALLEVTLAVEQADRN